MRTKKTKKEEAAPVEATAQREAQREQEWKTIGLDSLYESPWQLHTVFDSDDLEALRDSIKTQGLLQALLVRPMKERGREGDYEVIDGHRRLAALKLLKEPDLYGVPCVVADMTDEEAQAAMLASNAQRVASDPLLEASVIAQLAKAGRSQRWIAAAMGLGNGTVARRARLAQLEQCWLKDARSRQADGEKVSAALLETIARYEAEVQRQMWSVASMGGKHNAIAGLGEVNPEAEAKRLAGKFTRILSLARFDTSVCARCRKNTANEGELFPDETGGGKCQDADCYKTRTDMAVEDKLRKARERGEKIYQVKNSWEVPHSWEATEVPTEKNCAVYVYPDHDGTRIVKWSVEPEDKRKTKQEEEQREKERAERRRRCKMADDVREYAALELENWVRKAGEGPRAIEKLKKTAEFRALAARNLESCMKKIQKEGALSMEDAFIDDWIRIYPKTLDERTDEERKAYAKVLEEEEGE